MEITYNPKPLTAGQLQSLSQEVKQVLTDLYGERLDRVILYGSYARSDFHAESDVDYLVVLKNDLVQYGTEIRHMGDQIGELSMDYNLFIAVKPVSAQKYKFSQLPFYQNVRREGIAL